MLSFTSQDLAHVLADTFDSGWDEIQNILEKASSDDARKQLFIHEWLFKFKQVGLVYRDSALNLLKSEQYLRDRNIDSDSHHTLKTRILDTISAANTELDNELESIFSSKQKNTNTWKHNNDPYPILSKQIADISTQLKDIPQKKVELDRLHETFTHFYEQHDTHFIHTLDSLNTYQSILTDTNQILDTVKVASTSDEYARLSKKVLKEIERLEDKGIRTNYGQIDLGTVDTLKLPITTGDSSLAVKTIDIDSEVNGWHVFTYMPEIKEMDAQVRSFEDRVEAMLFQLSNRLTALAELGEPASPERLDIIGQPADLLLSELSSIYQQTDEKIAYLRNDLNTQISTSQLYSESYNFLPISRLTRLAGSSTYTASTPLDRLEQARLWLSNYKEGIQGKFSPSSDRMVDQITNFHKIYERRTSSFILKRGYIGHSFVSERPELLEKIDTVIDHWRKGFGQAIFLHGLHGSGKSTLLDAMKYRFPQKDFYILRPNQKLDVNGESIVIQDNLLETVKAITKLNTTTRTVIAIDSLDDFYTSPERLFIQFEKLTKIINKKSKNFLFIVLGHSKLQEKLSRYMNLKFAFTAFISCDRMSKTLMSESIYRRVQAVHSQEELENKGDYLKEVVKDAVSRAHGNIGFAILQFKHKLMHGKFIDLHSPELEKLIMKYKDVFVEFTIHGYISEKRIRDMYNDIGKDKANQFFNAMTSMQILHRPTKGLIGIHGALKLPIDQIIRNI